MIKEAYRHLLAKIYDPFLASLEKTLEGHRRELLSMTQGTILEVGAGTGVNFSYYPGNVEVYAIEPSKPMLNEARKKLNRADIKLFHSSLENFYQSGKRPGKFDFIVSMLVLCTIPHPEQAVEIYKELLKPGGKLLVLEHIHATGSAYGKLQTLINPIWKPLADGCNLTRRQDKILKNHGFIPLREEYFRTGTDWYKAVMIPENSL